LSTEHPWVILFDIDGTLLTVNRTFNRPLIRSILDDLNIHYPDMEKEGFSGRTDHDILTSFLVNHDFDESLYSEMKAMYLERTESQMKPEHVIRHEHIDEALSFFERIGAYIGLLTGNYPSAAKAKLRVADIDFDFKFGAYGEFDKDRNQLPLIAIKEVEKNLGIEPDPKKFVIIGDTPRDIQCANFAGMKSVAVTTGRFNEKEMKEHNPDIIISNLSEPEKWFNKITKDK
jgi:phosphoglycolate phosphatase-like HAD superfamily hydrolase